MQHEVWKGPYFTWAEAEKERKGQARFFHKEGWKFHVEKSPHSGDWFVTVDKGGRK